MNFDLVLDFIIDNWYYLLSILILLLSFIISILRKRANSNLVDSVKSSLLELLPSFISLAEVSEVPGEDKKNFVINLALDRISSLLGCKLSDTDRAYWVSFITSSLESILSTPQKKSVSKEVKNEKNWKEKNRT